jgi:class 3 adenylate cyclase
MVNVMLPDKASGTFTFLFTDIEGSTRLWERFPQAMRRALERHDSILLTAATTAGGHVVKTTGDGLMAVFGSAADAVRACLAAQRGLMEEPWPETGALRVRMGLHSGEAQLRGDDYFGPAVIRGARIMAVGHGGQVLLSGTSASLVADRFRTEPA